MYGVWYCLKSEKDFLSDYDIVLSQVSDHRKIDEGCISPLPIMVRKREG